METGMIDPITGVKKLGHAACNLCRARKAKCSGANPCSNCARRGEECRYEEWKVRGRKPSHLKAETTPGQLLSRDRGIYALFHGEPLRTSELTYMSRFFSQVFPAIPCVRRSLVETVINARADRGGVGSNDPLAEMAAGHMLVYGIIAVGAQVSKEFSVAKQYCDLAVQGLPYVLENPTELGAIALIVVTYYYFGVKSKCALACYCMNLSHVAYMLRRKRVRIDPLINQSLLFFEKVALVKLQKTRELYRLPSPEELAPIIVSPSDPTAIDAVYGRIGDICVMLACLMIGTRWQARMDPEAAAVVQQLFAQIDQHTQYCMTHSPATLNLNVLAVVCALKAVFLYKSGQPQEAMVWGANTVQMIQNMPKPVHCFLFVLVASNVNEILIRNGGGQLSNILTSYLGDLGLCWPIAQHYREKRVEYYGSAAALFHVANAAAVTTGASSSGHPAASMLQFAEGGGAYEDEGDEEVMDHVSFAVDAAATNISGMLFNQVSSSVNLVASAAAIVAGTDTIDSSSGVGSGEPSEPPRCAVCGYSGDSCGCEGNRARAPYHSARLEKKRALGVPEVLKPPAFAKIRRTAPPLYHGVSTSSSGLMTSASAAAAAVAKSTDRMRRRSTGASVGTSSSEDLELEADDLLDDLLFTFMPEGVGNLGLFGSISDGPVPHTTPPPVPAHAPLSTGPTIPTMMPMSPAQYNMSMQGHGSGAATPLDSALPPGTMPRFVPQSPALNPGSASTSDGSKASHGAGYMSMPQYTSPMAPQMGAWMMAPQQPSHQPHAMFYATMSGAGGSPAGMQFSGVPIAFPTMQMQGQGAPVAYMAVPSMPVQTTQQQQPRQQPAPRPPHPSPQQHMPMMATSAVMPSPFPAPHGSITPPATLALGAATTEPAVSVPVLAPSPPAAAPAAADVHIPVTPPIVEEVCVASVNASGPLPTPIE